MFRKSLPALFATAIFALTVHVDDAFRRRPARCSAIAPGMDCPRACRARALRLPDDHHLRPAGAL